MTIIRTNEANTAIVKFLTSQDNTDIGTSQQLMLFTNATVDKYTTYASLTEPTGGGYARITIAQNRWTVSGNYAYYDTTQNFIPVGTAYTGVVRGYALVTTGTNPKILVLETNTSLPTIMLPGYTYAINLVVKMDVQAIVPSPPIIRYLYGFGYNGRGAIGDGTTTDRHDPTPIDSLLGYKKISKYYHTLAILNGDAYGWGEDSNGQLGDGGSSYIDTPLSITGTGDCTMVAAGANHSLFILGGALYACGTGYIGGGSSVLRSAIIQIGSFTDWIFIAAGNNCSFGIRSGGQLYSWGDGAGNVLGQGSTSTVTTPQAVSGITNCTMVACGRYHTTILLSTGERLACGINNYGQFGNGAISGSTVSTFTSTDGLLTWQYIAAGINSACGIDSSDFKVWGREYSSTPVTYGSSGFTKCDMSKGVIGNPVHFIAIKNKTPFVMGKNTVGQLGDGTTTDSLTTLIQVGASTQTLAVAAGYQSSAAIY